ncbi:MAG: hypothetical protein H6502_04730 [Candidatus Woesearchaeota archaeon]|nr:MAG: hypothetical protein H6502_04730 [Candidatus Woesearchaeota archaeon]
MSLRNLSILNSKEVKLIFKDLQEKFGVEEKRLPFVFLKNSKDRIFLVNKEIELVDLDAIRVDLIGLYIGTIQSDGMRLSIEGSQLIAPLASKNVLELTKSQRDEWIKGHDQPFAEEGSRTVIVTYAGDVLGCGKIKNKTLLNYVPKSRRLVVINEREVHDGAVSCNHC